MTEKSMFTVKLAEIPDFWGKSHFSHFSKLMGMLKIDYSSVKLMSK
jgi:hypothetical protein